MQAVLDQIKSCKKIGILPAKIASMQPDTLLERSDSKLKIIGFLYQIHNDQTQTLQGQNSKPTTTGVLSNASPKTVVVKTLFHEGNNANPNSTGSPGRIPPNLSAGRLFFGDSVPRQDGPSHQPKHIPLTSNQQQQQQQKQQQQQPSTLFQLRSHSPVHSNLSSIVSSSPQVFSVNAGATAAASQLVSSRKQQPILETLTVDFSRSSSPKNNYFSLTPVGITPSEKSPLADPNGGSFFPFRSQNNTNQQQWKVLNNNNNNNENSNINNSILKNSNSRIFQHKQSQNQQQYLDTSSITTPFSQRPTSALKPQQLQQQWSNSNNLNTSSNNNNNNLMNTTARKSVTLLDSRRYDTAHEANDQSKYTSTTQNRQGNSNKSQLQQSQMKSPQSTTCQRGGHSSEQNAGVIDQETKNRIFEWLVDLVIIKDDPSVFENLAEFAKNGAMLCDLLNRLRGKSSEVVKGVVRNAKCASQINANFKKAFEFLATLEKLNPRYNSVTSIPLLKDACQHVFFGLLDDIWHWYYNRISPFDHRWQQEQQQQQQPVDQSEKRHSRHDSSLANRQMYDSICSNQDAKKQIQRDEAHTSAVLAKQSMINASNIALNQSKSYQQYASSMRSIKGPMNLSNHPTNQYDTHSHSNMNVLSQSMIDDENDQQQLQNVNSYGVDRNYAETFKKTKQHPIPIESLPLPLTVPTSSYSEISQFRKNLNHSGGYNHAEFNQYDQEQQQSNQRMQVSGFAAQMASNAQSGNAVTAAANSRQQSLQFQPLDQRQKPSFRLMFPSNSEIPSAIALQSDTVRGGQQQQQQQQQFTIPFFSPGTNTNIPATANNGLGAVSPVGHRSTKSEIYQQNQLEQSQQKSVFLQSPSDFGMTKNFHTYDRAASTVNIFSPIAPKGKAVSSSTTSIVASSAHLSKDLEKICREWLLDLEFSPKELIFFTSKDNKFLFEDPARNGQFVVRVLQRVGIAENVLTQEFQSKTIDECRSNWQKILNLFISNRIALPAAFVGMTQHSQVGNAAANASRQQMMQQQYQLIESIVAGNFNAFYAVLFAIKQHVDGPYDNDRYSTKIFDFLPYSPAQLSSLETSLYQWLASEDIGMVVDEQGNATREAIATAASDLFTQFKERLLNGLFWVDIAEIVTGLPVKTVNTRPKMQLHYFNNVANALALLKSMSSMGKRFLFCEEKLLTLNKQCILGLLEDLRMLNDGQNPRVGSDATEYFKNGPYLCKPTQQINNGDQSVQKVNKSMTSLHDRSMLVNKSNNAVGNTSVISNSHLKSNSRMHTAGSQASFSHVNNQTSGVSSKKTIDISNVDARNNNVQQQKQQNHNQQVFKRFLSPNKATTNSTTVGMQSPSPIHFFETPIHRLSSQNGIDSHRSAFSTAGAATAALLNDFDPVYNQTHLSASIYQNSEGEIKEWIRQLGFADFIDRIDFSADVLTEFKDGIFLANLIGELEGIQIKGIIMEPKKQSCCIHNIRNSFNVLRGKRDMDFALLDTEFLLFTAQSSYILALLNNIKHIYRAKLNYQQSRRELSKSKVGSIVYSPSSQLSLSQSAIASPSNMFNTFQQKKAEELFYSKQEREKYILTKQEWKNHIVKPIKAKI